MKNRISPNETGPSFGLSRRRTNGRWHIRCWQPGLTLALLLAAAGPRAAETEMDSALRRALFEEEANQNLEAAIEAYGKVIATHDAGRKLAATAVFRLGECYRKLGRTNEAIAQYRRVQTEFTEQSMLVTLSRQNLVGLGVDDPAAGGSATGASGPRPLQQQTLAGLRAEAAGLALVLDRLKAMEGAQLRQALLTVSPNSLLPVLLEKAGRIEQRIAELNQTVSKEHPTMREQLSALAAVNRQIDEQVDGLLAGLQLKLNAAKRQAEALESELGTTDSAGGPGGARVLDEQSRAKLKDMLSQELKLAENLLEEQKRKVAAGVVAPGETVRFERDVLSIQRQLIAVDGLSRANDRKEWRDLLLREIELTEQAGAVEQKKNDSGLSSPAEVARLQREVLGLKRELLEFDARPEVTAVPSRSGSPVTNEEEAEIRRIQAMIRNSPDLVNAGNVVIGTYNDIARYGTPLHKAAQNGQLVVAQFLLENGAELETQDGYGRTALSWAAANGHKAMVELLLRKGADPNARVPVGAPTGSRGFGPLHFAAQAGYKSVCESLLAGKADVNLRNADEETALHLVASRGHQAIAVLLLAKGADVQARSSVGGTPLHYAAGVGGLSVAEVLLANGAALNAQGNDGATPLYLAMQKGRIPLARLLVDKGADPNLALKHADPALGDAPLNIAVRTGDINMVRLLLEKGATPNRWMQDSRWTPLHEAANRGNNAMVEVLLAQGAKVDAQTTGGLTPLAQSIQANASNLIAVVETLLKAKADVNLAAESGATPLFWAANNRQTEVVKMLLEAGAQVNAMTSDGQTPLSVLKAGRSIPKFPNSSLRAIPPLPVGSAVALGPRPTLPRPLPGPVAEPASEIIALLERHGALADPRRFSVISTTRNAENRMIWFYKDTSGWNQFTLFELVAILYQDPNKYPFPDLARLSLNRMDPQTGKTEDIPFNLAAALENGECSADRPLAWGDVLEVPEQVHLLNAQWEGLSMKTYESLQKCLERTVMFTINGRTTNAVLRPFRSLLPDDYKGTITSPKNCWQGRIGEFRLKTWLENSRLLLTSSDLSRVTVKRVDPHTKTLRELILDLQQPESMQNDLWLRDGDAVEVPARME